MTNPATFLSTLFGAGVQQASSTAGFLTSPPVVVIGSALLTVLVLKAVDHRDTLMQSAARVAPVFLG